jgi:hypothetical protein
MSQPSPIQRAPIHLPPQKKEPSLSQGLDQLGDKEISQLATTLRKASIKKPDHIQILVDLNSEPGKDWSGTLKQTVKREILLFHATHTQGNIRKRTLPLTPDACKAIVKQTLSDAMQTMPRQVKSAIRSLFTTTLTLQKADGASDKAAKEAAHRTVRDTVFDAFLTPEISSEAPQRTNRESTEIAKAIVDTSRLLLLATGHQTPPKPIRGLTANNLQPLIKTWQTFVENL